MKPVLAIIKSPRNTEFVYASKGQFNFRLYVATLKAMQSVTPDYAVMGKRSDTALTIAKLDESEIMAIAENLGNDLYFLYDVLIYERDYKRVSISYSWAKD